MLVLVRRESADFSEYRSLGHRIQSGQACPESDVPRLPIRPSQLNGNVPSKTDETDYLRDTAFLFLQVGQDTIRPLLSVMTESLV